MIFKDYIAKVPVPQKLKDDVFNAEKKKLFWIDNLSKINIFVGANNSGKSLLLREILKDKIDPIYFSNDLRKSLNDTISNLNKELKENLKVIGGGRGVGFYKNSGLRIDYSLIDNVLKNTDDNYSYLQLLVSLEKELYPKLNEHNYDITLLSQNSSQNIHYSIPQTIAQHFPKIRDKIKTEISKFHFKEKYSRIYVPSVRSLRKFARQENLENHTKQEYKFADNDVQAVNHKYINQEVKIENGQTMYEDVNKNLRSGWENQKKIRDFQKFLSENFFEGKEVILTASIEKENLEELTIKIGDEKEQPIYNLGDGLQMLIILTFPLFKYDYGLMVIEESELFIHPGLQKKLIDIFSHHPKAHNFLFFLATHSNHLLDTINSHDDISIFSVQKFYNEEDSSDQKLPNFIVDNLSRGNENSLRLLGVTNTSVFLANCTIWVEGITDKLYLSKYILEYLKHNSIDSKYKSCLKFQEGIHYSFAYSSGDNIIHWDFSDEKQINELSKKVVVKNLCGKAMVIVDGDNDKNIKRKEQFFKELGGKFLILPVIEIENLLTNEVIAKTINSFPTCSDINIEPTNFLEEKKYSKIRLGTYIEDNILKGIKKESRKKFSVKDDKKNKEEAANLTLNCKLEFCDYAISHIRFENMTEPSKKVVEKVLDFIIEHNRYFFSE